LGVHLGHTEEVLWPLEDMDRTGRPKVVDMVHFGVLHMPGEGLVHIDLLQVMPSVDKGQLSG